MSRPAAGRPGPASTSPPTRARHCRRPSDCPTLKALITVLGLFSLVNFPDALLRVHQLGLSTGGVIAAYIVYNVVCAALAYPAGALSGRAPRHLVFALGLVFFAVGYLGLGRLPLACVPAGQRPGALPGHERPGRRPRRPGCGWTPKRRPSRSAR